ncbi:MAG: DMT family transporter [Gammaproteobacteria bacterium]|nr:DMT family transporter [Gammaproteobacteria bacterium]
MASGNLRGIAAMLMAVAAFAVMDGILKLLTAHYPPMQIAALRGAASLPFLLGAVLAFGSIRDLRPVRWGLHLVRGLLAVVMLTGFVYAVKVLSLADAYAIFFVAPLLVTAFAVPILKEHVDWQRWTAIGLGLVGVLVMLRPTGAGLSLLGAAGAFVSAVAYALASVSVRVLTRTETTASMVFWFLLLLTLFCSILAAPEWTPVRREEWPWIAALGIFGGLGQHFITEAFRHGQASVVAPFEYTALLWGIGLDWLFWSVVPGPGLYLGGSIIIGAGLYLIWRERQLHLETAARLEAAGTPP